jgi:VIT1/CCC1 family predicted Fe2+/Mn2+ transporter
MSGLQSWTQEKESVFLYGVLAAAETAPERRALFENLAREAESQAAIWEAELRREGTPAPAFEPSTRARVVAVLVRRFGAERMRGVLAAMKVRGMSIYGPPMRDAAGGGDPRARGAKAAPPPQPIAGGSEPSEGSELDTHAMPTSVDEIGRRHRGVGGARGGNLRAAVFGANDGLVSNASLILGVAGATSDRHLIGVSGIAGLLAGAFSMAAGEYVSMRSQREMFERQISAERDELRRYPAEEAAELALIYEARGLPKEQAARAAQSIIANPDNALETLAREELGLDPAELGSPWGAALFSFLSFAGGALVPLLPFALGGGSRALAISIGLTGAALFAIGATISLFTGRGAVRGGLRMLLIGAAAGATTNLIGRLLGVK